MKPAKILSLNIGKPKLIEWNGRSLLSSMEKHPVPGPLMVNEKNIEDDVFADPRFHGTPDSVLYVYGLTSIQKFMDTLYPGENRKHVPGAIGETVLVDEFDEEKVSVGDVFQIGEVRAQATYPRIPCGKVSIRMKNPRGQKAMQLCERSGVYFRIIKPGKIALTDEVVLFEKAKVQIPIKDVYGKLVRREEFSPAEIARFLENGAFPKKILAQWRA